MRISLARGMLAAVFLIFLILNLVDAVVPFWRGHLEYASMRQLLELVFGLYLVHLGVILGGYFGQRQLGPKDTDTPVFLVAFLVSLIWNILASWFLFWMCWMDTSGGSIADAKDYLAKYPQFSSTLVSGALAYFFVMGTKEQSARTVTAGSPAVRS